MDSTTSQHQCVRCLRVTPTRPQKCTVCGFPEQTPWFVMVYESRRRRSALGAYKKDLARLRQQGYEPLPEPPAWVAGDHTGKTRTAIHLLLAEWFDLVFPPTGYLRVNLRRWDLTPEQALAQPTDGIKWGA